MVSVPEAGVQWTARTIRLSWPAAWSSKVRTSASAGRRQTKCTRYDVSTSVRVGRRSSKWLKGRRHTLVPITITVTIAAGTSNPEPASTPTAAAHQRVAAVVSPRTLKPSLKITPAPRKPIPDTTCAAMRVALLSPAVIPESATKAADPVATSACVRMPAMRWCHWRSTPTARPQSRATRMRSVKSASVMGRGPHAYDARTLGARKSSHAAPGIQQVTQAVADQVEAEHREVDGQAGERRVPPPRSEEHTSELQSRLHL